MDPDQTYNSIVFSKSYDNETKGVRQSTARAVNTPDVMTVLSQPYVDSQTKVPGTRYTLRFDRHDIDANLALIVSSMYLVIALPKTVTDAQFNVLKATFRAAIADADLIEDVLNNEK